MTRKSTLFSAATATLISSVALASSAWGQTTTDEMSAATDEVAVQKTVIVTARRVEESLQDVPGSISVLSQEVIENAGITRADDFIALTPGVSIVNAAEAGDTQVNIRGINGARDAENSFAFILDGVLFTNPAAFNREYTNLQQIEVFKGPQGAIYGRNAAAGAILVTTTTPDNTFEGKLTASIAEDKTSLIKGSVSGPLIENKMYYRLSADWRATDGFYRNSFQNGAATVDAFESYNVNGRLVYEPNPDLTFDFKARYGEIAASSIGFNPTFHLPVFATATSTTAAYEDVNEHDFVFQPNIVSDNDQTALELVGKFDYEMDADRKSVV
jgi:iron complex outermembrane recepter protein